MTYDYICTKCNHTWEEDQKITDDPIKVCAACKEETAKRQISQGNFILTGSGWFNKGGY